VDQGPDRALERSDLTGLPVRHYYHPAHVPDIDQNGEFMSRVQYEKGEREQSATSSGDAKAAELADRTIQLILSDFAVDKADIKHVHHQALSDMVKLFHLGRTRAKHVVTLIEGYSDAVGGEADNAKLRKLRAYKVSGFLQGLIQTVDRNYQAPETYQGAPVGQYLNPNNDTPAARADNRAVKILLKPVPVQTSFFTVRVPPAAFNKQTETHGVVSADVWLKGRFPVANLYIYGRLTWASRKEPLWERGVTYYNTHQKPLHEFYDTIIVHHTANRRSVNGNEEKHHGEGYAALGYHLAIDKKGTVFQGRPLEVMGGHAGEIKGSGEMGDPDWGAAGIVLLGDFESRKENLWSPDEPTPEQLKSLKDLVTIFKNRWGITRLLMHKEVIRGGKPTVCPGENMYKHVEEIRRELKMLGPKKP
jgi:hypothetical protein